MICRAPVPSAPGLAANWGNNAVLPVGVKRLRWVCNPEIIRGLSALGSRGPETLGPYQECPGEKRRDCAERLQAGHF